MKRVVKNFLASFMHLFFLANFVVGSAVYAVNPNQISPAPGGVTMTILGVASAVVSLAQCVKMSQNA